MQSPKHFVSFLRTSGHSRWNILREILSIRCTVPIDLGWKEIVSLFSCLGKWTPMQLGFSSLLNTAGLKKWSRGFTSETQNQLFFIWFRKTGLKTGWHRKMRFLEKFLLCEIALFGSIGVGKEHLNFSQTCAKDRLSICDYNFICSTSSRSSSFIRILDQICSGTAFKVLWFHQNVSLYIFSLKLSFHSLPLNRVKFMYLFSWMIKRTTHTREKTFWTIQWCNFQFLADRRFEIL